MFNSKICERKGESKMRQKMMLIFSLLLCFTLLFTMCAVNLQAATTVTSDSTGTHDGFYYSFWNQGGGSVVMTLGNGGNYSVTWSNCSNFTCGKGWKTGSANKVVNFTGSFNGGNNGYLALYGWTKNPLIEYYVIENYGSWVPPGGNSIGTMQSDGGTYNIYKMVRTNQPSIIGTATFDQFFSVRTSKRSTGTITFKNHADAWKNKGLNLGSTWDYLIMESEGYQSSGSSNITVSDGGTPNTVTPTKPQIATSTPTKYTTQKKYGDVNGDGIVDSGDFTILRKYLIGNIKSLQASENADVNADGAIDSGDYTLLRQYLIGKISSFPAESGSVTLPTPTKTTSYPSPTPNQSTGSKFHCFLLLGQSNMAGWPKAQASDMVTDSRILALGYDNNQWGIAKPPLHEAYQGAIGPGDWFAKTIIKELPEGDTIGLIPCAISGEKIETFMKSGGSKYNWIISRAKSAQQKGGVIDGILFHQGCSNNGQADWPSKVTTLVSDLKKDLGLGDVPFLAGELLYSGGCSGHNTLVNKLPSMIKNCYVISANGLSGDPADSWKLHFNHDSQVEFGKRYAAKMIEALGW